MIGVVLVLVLGIALLFYIFLFASLETACELERLPPCAQVASYI